MTVIIYYSDHMERWNDITTMRQVPGMINLIRDKELVKQVTVAMKMEVIP